MDFTGLGEAIELFSKAVGLLKGLKDMMPESPKKEEATKALQRAEEAFKTAEAEAAKNLGYEICRCTWPPQIMLSKGYSEADTYSEVFECPKCGRIFGDEPLPPLRG